VRFFFHFTRLAIHQAKIACTGANTSPLHAGNIMAATKLPTLLQLSPCHHHRQQL
jgi:hypothetical protein